MLDLLLLNVPRLSVIYPPLGTSLLKGIVEASGYSCTVKDYNLELYNQSKTDSQMFDELEKYFTVRQKTSDHAAVWLNNWYDSVVSDILSINPTWVGISVFTYHCQQATLDIVTRLRKVYTGKIVIGGAGISSNGIASNENDFGNDLLQSGLIDYYIRGDGDISLVNLLSGEAEAAGINNDNYEQFRKVEQSAYANFDDVIKNKYNNGKQFQLPIVASRGCVRKCTFCDIHQFWKKYSYRSGADVATELIQHYKKYGQTDFYFVDSLINGSIKEFKNLCVALLEFYEENNLPDKFFTWGGQFIVRSSLQMTDDMFEIAARAGLTNLAIGVETGSDKVRKDMAKGFTTRDLEYTVKQLQKNNMSCYFLIIVGYPTEEQKHFNETVQMFERFVKYKDVITGVNLGHTATLDEGTPLFKHADNFEPEFYNVLGYDWINKDNPTLTFKERIRRRIILQERLMDLGYTIWNADIQLKILKAEYDKLHNRD